MPPGALGAVPEPPVQPRAVFRRHLDLGHAGQLPDRVRGSVRQRRAREDEAFLEQVEHRAQPDERRGSDVQQRQKASLDQSAGQCAVLPTVTSFRMMPHVRPFVYGSHGTDADGSSAAAVRTVQWLVRDTPRSFPGSSTMPAARPGRRNGRCRTMGATLPSTGHEQAGPAAVKCPVPGRMMEKARRIRWHVRSVRPEFRENGVEHTRSRRAGGAGPDRRGAGDRGRHPPGA